MKLAFAAALAVATLAADRPAHAGWRELEVLLVDATPAGAGAAGERCVRELVDQFDPGETVLDRKTLAAVTPKLGNPPLAILAWTAELLAPLRPYRRDDYDGTYDAILVVDCRPDERHLDIVVDAITPGLATYRLRTLAIDRALLAWLVDDVRRHGYAGFSP